MRRTQTATRTRARAAQLVEQTTPVARNLPAVVGADGVVLEPEVVDVDNNETGANGEVRDKVRIAVVGGRTSRVKLPDGNFTVRDLLGEAKLGLQQDMEFFVNGMDATLDTPVRNGDAVVGLDRFDAGGFRSVL